MDKEVYEEVGDEENTEKKIEDNATSKELPNHYTLGPCIN